LHTAAKTRVRFGAGARPWRASRHRVHAAGPAGTVAERPTPARTRGAATLVTGATGMIVVRADYAYYAAAFVAACRRHQARFSVTVRIDPKIRRTITSIDEEDRVRFTDHEAGALPEPVEALLLHWQDLSGAEAGAIEDIAAVYQNQPAGRLVVLGALGAGKTVLLSRLVLGPTHSTARGAAPTCQPQNRGQNPCFCWSRPAMAGQHKCPRWESNPHWTGFESANSPVRGRRPGTLVPC